jgi:hypothetical protein
VADRNPSFFGPVLPQRDGAPEAFTEEELLAMRPRRIEVELLRLLEVSPFAAPRGFETPLRARPPAPPNARRTILPPPL